MIPEAVDSFKPP